MTSVAPRSGSPLPIQPPPMSTVPLATCLRDSRPLTLPRMVRISGAERSVTAICWTRQVTGAWRPNQAAMRSSQTPPARMTRRARTPPPVAPISNPPGPPIDRRHVAALPEIDPRRHQGGAKGAPAQARVGVPVEGAMGGQDDARAQPRFDLARAADIDDLDRRAGGLEIGRLGLQQSGPRAR